MNRWELPEGWEWKTVGEIAEVRLGRQRSPDRAMGPNLRPYLRAANVTWNGLDLSDVKEMDFTPKEQTTYQLQVGDILLSEASGSASEVGKPAIWSGEIDGCCFQNTLVRVRATPELAPYLLRYFRHLAQAGVFADASKGSGIHHLGQEGMAATDIPLPPPEEQTRIVTRLNALQARITTARAGLDELRQLAAALKRSVLDAAFRGELTADWRAAHPDAEPASALLDRLRAERRHRWQEAHPKKPYVAPEPVDPTDLPELPEGWCWARLAELIERVEAGRSPSSLGRPAEFGEYGVIKVSAMTWEEFDPGENKALLPGDVPDARDTVKAGDLLISRANTRELVGAVVLVATDHPQLMLSDKSLRLCYLPEIVPTFLLYALRTRPVRAVFEDDSTGNSLSMLNITQQQILSVPIPLAPLAEQQQLAASLASAWSTANHALDAAQALADDLTTTERALLTAAFRGELLPPAVP